jgi:hypothetical protein
MGVLMNRIPVLLLLLSTSLMAQTPSPTIRICDESGCSERPRDSVTFNPAAVGDTAAEQQAAKLIALAEKDPRAAYDLGLRYFRGDGVRQDSYQALKWMRDAAERGFLKAQTAVGRFYLMGLEEMGSDPAEAEKWLSIAAGRGDKEAKSLLAQASKAKQNEVAYRRWADSQRVIWNSYWMERYQYEWQWRNGGWYDHRPYGARY